MTSHLGCILLDARTSLPRLSRRLAVLSRQVKRSSLPLAIVVIDDSGGRHLAPVTHRFGAQRLDCSGATLGERINVAVARTQGEVLIFPGSEHHRGNWLGPACDALLHQHWDAIVFQSRPLGRWLRLWQSLLRRQPPILTLCVSRAWFERIGGCDPQLNYQAIPELVERLRACQARLTTKVLDDTDAASSQRAHDSLR